MSNRRQFIAILPFAGVAALAACGDKNAPATATPAPMPAPAPAPTPAPAAEAAAPAPAAAPTPATAGAGPMVDPADPTAVSLGYVADASTAKDAKHVAGAACGNCSLYAGQPGDSAGPCPLYAGRRVAATGWCTAYVKKG